MGKIYEKDETEDDKEGGTDEGEIIAPKDEEGVGDSKGYTNEDQPQQDFGTPPAALQ